MKLHLLSAFSLVISGLAAQAALVYDFNSIVNDYSAGTSDPVLTGAGGIPWAKATNNQRPFSTEPMQPATNYSGPVFFGGFTSDTGSGGFDFVRFETDVTTLNGVANKDWLRVTQLDDTDPGVTNNHEFLFMGATTSEAIFDGSSSVTVRVSRDPGNMRLVLRSGGLYYVSDQTLAMDNTVGVTADLFNISTFTYSLYDPATDLDYVVNTSSYNPYTTSFDAAGILFTRSSTNAMNTHLGQFTVDAAAVPESGAMALLAVGLGVANLRRRARR